MPRRVLGQARRGPRRHARRGLVGAAVPRGGAVRAPAADDARRGGGRGGGHRVRAAGGGVPGRRARHALPRARRLPVGRQAGRSGPGSAPHGGRACAGLRPRGRGGGERPRARARAAAGGVERAPAARVRGRPRAGGHGGREGGGHSRVRGRGAGPGGARLPEHRRAGRPRHVRRARRHPGRVPWQPGVPGEARLLRRRAGRDPPHRANHRADHRRAAPRRRVPRRGVRGHEGRARPRAPEARAARRDERRAARRAGEAGRRPARGRLGRAFALPVQNHLHARRLRAPRRPFGAGGAALALRRHDARLRRPGGTVEGNGHRARGPLRRARRRELRRRPAGHVRVHHARGRADRRRAAGQARGSGGTPRQAVRPLADARGRRLHGGVQRSELPRPPGHEAGLRGPGPAHPGDAGFRRSPERRSCRRRGNPRRSCE